MPVSSQHLDNTLTIPLSHCPWINNCVALANHRIFVLYILFLVISLAFITNLTLTYIPLLPEPTDKSYIQCSILGPELCTQWCKDPFTLVINGWGAVQITWTTMLLFVQFSQIARAMTTYESMRGHHTGALTTAITTGSTSFEASLSTDSAAAPIGSSAPHAHKKQKEGCFAQWKKLLGLDTFVATALHGSRAPEVLARRKKNPYNRGIVRNCGDFWCDAGAGPKGLLFGKKGDGAGLLGGEQVDYRRLYEIPSAMRYRSGGYEAVEREEEV